MNKLSKLVWCIDTTIPELEIKSTKDQAYLKERTKKTWSYFFPRKQDFPIKKNKMPIDLAKQGI